MLIGVCLGGWVCFALPVSIERYRNLAKSEPRAVPRLRSRRVVVENQIDLSESPPGGAPGYVEFLEAVLFREDNTSSEIKAVGSVCWLHLYYPFTAGK